MCIHFECSVAQTILPSLFNFQADLKTKMRNLQRELKKAQNVVRQEVARKWEETQLQDAKKTQKVVDKATRKMDASKRN